MPCSALVELLKHKNIKTQNLQLMLLIEQHAGIPPRYFNRQYPSTRPNEQDRCKLLVTATFIDKMSFNAIAVTEASVIDEPAVSQLRQATANREVRRTEFDKYDMPNDTDNYGRNKTVVKPIDKLC